MELLAGEKATPPRGLCKEQNRNRCKSEKFLAAPPGVSPASATEEKEHQQNDQYEFHVETSLHKRKIDGPLKQPSHFFTTRDTRSGLSGSLVTIDLCTTDGSFDLRIEILLRFSQRPHVESSRFDSTCAGFCVRRGHKVDGR